MAVQVVPEPLAVEDGHRAATVRGAGGVASPRPLSADAPMTARVKLLMAADLVVLAASLAGAVAASRAQDWRPPALVATLVLLAVGSDFLAVRVNHLWFSGSFLAVVLTIVLEGPAPAVAVAIVSVLIADLRSGAPRRRTVTNLAVHAAFPLITGVLIWVLAGSGSLQPGDDRLVGVVLGGFLIALALNHALTALAVTAAGGLSLREQVRGTVLPLLPSEIATGLVALGVAYVYLNAGMVALTLFAVAVIVFQYLVRELVISQDRARALEDRTVELVALQGELTELAASRGRLVAESLDAEDRERRKLAESLHDEALQNVLAARQDLEDVRDGSHRALEYVDVALDRTVKQLRDAVFDLHPSILEHAGLAAALDAVAEQQGRRGRFRPSVSVASDAMGVEDQLLFSLGRELLTNAAKHSRASEVSVRVAREDGRLVLEVADDGVGCDLDARAAARRDGHIGLASSAERVDALGGAFEIASAPGEGMRVRVAIPCARAAAVADA
jgi:signal transduction histidine kinase